MVLVIDELTLGNAFGSVGVHKMQVKLKKLGPSLPHVMLKDIRNKEPARMKEEMELEKSEKERGQRNR